MHEMSLMSNVLKIVLDECEGANVVAVKAVRLTIGEQRDVVVDYAQGLFRYLARGTVAQEAELVVRQVPFTVRCMECGDIFKIDTRNPDTWECPRCGARQRYRVFSGHEFQVDAIEVELAGEAEAGEDTRVA